MFDTSGRVPPRDQREAFFAADWDARLRAMARGICRLPTREERAARIARFGQAQGIDSDDEARRRMAEKNIQRLEALVREEWNTMRGKQS